MNRAVDRRPCRGGAVHRTTGRPHPALRRAHRVGRDRRQGDIATQTEQVFRNLEAALAAAGARLKDVIKWSIYVVAGQPLQPAFEVFQRVWGSRPDPLLITLAVVSGLAQPDFLLELEAVAVIPD